MSPFGFSVQKFVIPALMTCCLSLSLFANGFRTMLGYATITSIALAVGTFYILIKRASDNKPVIPLSLISVPVVAASLVYFSLGVLSFAVADNRDNCLREMIQRVLIIFLPTVVFSLGPRKPSDLKFAILAYLPICGFIAICALWDAHTHKFETPSFTLNMHKNHIAGSCSIMATIAVAALLTTNVLKKRLIMVACLALALLGCVGSQGRAGFVCTIVATTVMMIVAKTRVRNVLIFIATVLIMGGALWKLLPEKAIEHVMTTKRHSANEVRIAIWSDIGPYLLNHPMTAVGWGNALVIGERFHYDCANVLLFEWMQLSLAGPIALLSVILFGVKLGFDNAKRLAVNTLLSFINLVGLGIVCGRFTHAMLDTFWIGRGVTLTTWAGVGMLVFVKLYLDQISLRSTPADQKSTATKVRNARSPALQR